MISQARNEIRNGNQLSNFTNLSTLDTIIHHFPSLKVNITGQAANKTHLIL